MHILGVFTEYRRPSATKILPEATNTKYLRNPEYSKKKSDVLDSYVLFNVYQQEHLIIAKSLSFNYTDWSRRTLLSFLLVINKWNQ